MQSVSEDTRLCGTVVTESGKVATWLDESVAHVCARLEHPATSFPEFSGDKVATLHTCVLFTAVTLEQVRPLTQFFSVTFL